MIPDFQNANLLSRISPAKCTIRSGVLLWCHDEAPGRMTTIYTAGLMARNRVKGETDVFVHDVDRDVEDKFSKAFLCRGYLIEEEGSRIRHFTIPSHRSSLGSPFCPL
ncbi:hypothetical protein ACS0TY_037006 [Phlomoides rotata]